MLLAHSACSTPHLFFDEPCRTYRSCHGTAECLIRKTQDHQQCETSTVRNINSAKHQQCETSACELQCRRSFTSWEMRSDISSNPCDMRFVLQLANSSSEWFVLPNQERIGFEYTLDVNDALLTKFNQNYSSFDACS
jgi:hypothetical protein